MARRRKRPRIGPGEVERVLAGDELATLDRLLELVRGVNPTRLNAVGTAERARAYAVKARLQSLVIAQHGAMLAVFPTRRPGVVALRLAARRGDACHAVVGDLDPAARTWVEAALRRLPGSPT